MNHQWPLGKGAAQPVWGTGEPRRGEAAAAAMAGLDGPAGSTQPPLPLALEEHVALIRAGAAVEAFARKRAVQILTHGHTPDKDLERPIGALAVAAKLRLDALTEIVGGFNGRMTLPAERREQCLRYVEIAGGILIALWDRCQAEVSQ